MRNIKQGTDEWHGWRRGNIGSSDASIIMGASPYKTPFDLWMEWTNRRPREPNKFATELGHRAEPFIRALAESAIGEILEPVTISSEDYPFMGASLDGTNLLQDIIVEMKLNNEEKHETALGGSIPPEHWPQLQHQLSVVETAEYLLYVSAPGNKDPWELTIDDLAFVRVQRDNDYIRQLIIAEAEFLEHLANDTPPERTERDYAQISNPQWRRAAQRWLKLNEKMEGLKKQMKEVEAKLTKLADDKSVSGCGVQVTLSEIPGRVAYNKIPELKNVNLDAYRGKGYIRWTVSKDKKESADARSE